MTFSPMLANALNFAFEKSTIEGKVTISLLVLLSLFSWTVIINKALQVRKARRRTRDFIEAFRAVRDPLELARTGKEFDGSPAFEVYSAGTEELTYHLKNNPVTVKPGAKGFGGAADLGQTDVFARTQAVKVSQASFESVLVAMDRTVSAETLSLEKGMIVLTTAVAGGPFIGLLGTVWGVMETFSGIAIAKSASLTAMAPGVAGALIATVVGLFVAIPAMFAYNLMITSVRGITQELDNFNSELGTALEHQYVDQRPLADEIADALRNMGLPGLDHARSGTAQDKNPANRA